MVEEINIEPKPGIPPSAGHLSELLGEAQRATRRCHRARRLSGSQGGRMAERAHRAFRCVILPYTVGGTPEAKDLFGLFDDTIARLLKAKKPA